MSDQNSAGGSALHSPDEIRDFIVRNYPELANARNMAIGLAGNTYRVVVTDGVHVNHTFRIDPKTIDEDRARYESQKAEKALKAKADGLRQNKPTKRVSERSGASRKPERDFER